MSDFGLRLIDHPRRQPIRLFTLAIFVFTIDDEVSTVPELCFQQPCADSTPYRRLRSSVNSCVFFECQVTIRLGIHALINDDNAPSFFIDLFYCGGAHWAHGE